MPDVEHIHGAAGQIVTVMSKGRTYTLTLCRCGMCGTSFHTMLDSRARTFRIECIGCGNPSALVTP